jgi:hypothetical protein
MRAYLDTEFSNTTAPDLISVGLVLASGEEFYAERTDVGNDVCSDFVKAIVLKKLGRFPGRAFDQDGMRWALCAWLTTMLKRHGTVELASDIELDTRLVAQLLGDDLPAGVTMVDVYDERSDLAREAFFMKAILDGRPDEDHHALYDARALRHACECGEIKAPCPGS